MMSLKAGDALEMSVGEKALPPAAPAHSAPASPGAPVSDVAPAGSKPITAGSPAPVADKAGLPQPEHPATPATAAPEGTKPPAAEAAAGGDGPAKMTLTFKSLNATLVIMQKQLDDAQKLNKALDERLKKFEAIPDLRNAPGRNNLSPTPGLSGERVLKNLNPATRDEVSRGFLTQAVIEALGGME